jgi:glycosyltransferase involved in cell wall biosynthesis
VNPKLSIIVPVYKVEQYIHKCVDSILAQTFTDFELILVNDGSPDNCGEICDEYSKKDNRIKVIHKENGGLSTARNAGLDLAKGDYVGFVDSDDWIESDMYELLYKMCENNNCDIAICTSKIHYTNRTIITGGNHSLIIYDKNQAMKAMLEGQLYDEVVWTKLFKRNVLENIRFPVGLTYEDTAFTYRVFHRTQKVCCIGEPKYNYIKRENSTMDRAIKNISIDAVLIYDEMYRFISEHYVELKKLVALKLANSSMVALNLISISGEFEEHEKKYYRVTSILNTYFRETIKLNYPATVKLLLTAVKIHPLLYRLIVCNLPKGA